MFARRFMESFVSLLHMYWNHEPVPSMRTAFGLPLPKGEGWGEGEGIVRQPTAHDSTHSRRRLPLTLDFELSAFAFILRSWTRTRLLQFWSTLLRCWN